MSSRIISSGSLQRSALPSLSPDSRGGDPTLGSPPSPRCSRTPQPTNMLFFFSSEQGQGQSLALTGGAAAFSPLLSSPPAACRASFVPARAEASPAKRPLLQPSRPSISASACGGGVSTPRVPFGELGEPPSPQGARGAASPSGRAGGSRAGPVLVGSHLELLVQGGPYWFQSVLQNTNQHVQSVSPLLDEKC